MTTRATTPSSSAPATTGWSPRRTSRRAGLRTLVAGAARAVGGALRHERAGAASGCRRSRTPSGGCGRRCRGPGARAATGCRWSRPDVRAFAPQPDGARSRCGPRRRDGRRPARAGPPTTPTRTSSSTAGSGRSRASSPTSATRRRPTSRRRASATRSPALRLGRAFRGLGEATAATILRVLPMAVADLVGERSRRDAMRGALAWRGVRSTAMGPWSAGTRRCCSTTRPATTAGRPARRCSPAAGPARSPRRSPRPRAVRRRDPDRRRGRRGHHERRPGDRRRPRRRRGDRGARGRLRASTRSGS